MTDMTDRERWAEIEASQCEKVAAGMDGWVAGWLARPPHPENYRMAYEIALRAQVWRDVASSLRQPHYIRLELVEQRP